jgi:uncharacterized protein (TIGR02301 family)
MPKRLLALILICLSLAAPLRAQDGASGAAPFDGDLQRLAEILGALHYLRGVCGSNEGPKWRNQMQAPIVETMVHSKFASEPTRIVFSPSTRWSPAHG